MIYNYYFRLLDLFFDLLIDFDLPPDFKGG
jgi:hypothetical protein